MNLRCLERERGGESNLSLGHGLRTRVATVERNNCKVDGAMLRIVDGEQRELGGFHEEGAIVVAEQ